MKRRISLPAVLAAGVLALAIAGCKAKPGGSCKIETKEVCADDKKALACHDGKWEEMACKGPDGCSQASTLRICDQSVAEDKEVCNFNDDVVCSADKKAMLQCVKNRWTQVQTCLGDRACSVEKQRVSCDNSTANLGDLCREEDDYACTPDKKVALVCRGGKFTQTMLCKGPKGCKIVGTKEAGFKVECDDSISNVGDPCERDDHYACTPDERTILRCHAKKFEVDDKCVKPKDKCGLRGGLIGCY